MTPQQRRAKATAAIVAFLQTLPEEQLRDVIDGLAVRGVVALEVDPDRARRVCGTCLKPYALCRRVAEATGDDHPFEPTTR